MTEFAAASFRSSPAWCGSRRAPLSRHHEGGARHRLGVALHPHHQRSATIGGHVAGGQADPARSSTARLGSRQCGGGAGADDGGGAAPARKARTRCPVDPPHLWRDRDHHRDRDAARPRLGPIEAVVAFPAYAGGALRHRACQCRRDHPQDGLGAGLADAAFFSAFGDMVPEGHSICSTMIARESWEEFEQFVAEAAGLSPARRPQGQGPIRVRR